MNSPFSIENFTSGQRSKSIHEFHELMTQKFSVSLAWDDGKLRLKPGSIKQWVLPIQRFISSNITEETQKLTQLTLTVKFSCDYFFIGMPNLKYKVNFQEGSLTCSITRAEGPRFVEKMVHNNQQNDNAVLTRPGSL